MKRLLVLSLIALGIAWGQADTGTGTEFRLWSYSPHWLSFDDIESHPSDIEFMDGGVAIVKIDMETGNVTIADGIGMNEASRKFWKILQEVAGRPAGCDDSPTTGSTAINHIYDDGTVGTKWLFYQNAVPDYVGLEIIETPETK